jgi:predicted amidophosphoribosyltransferase
MKANVEEYIKLCENHTPAEIAEIMGISKSSVSNLQAKTKVKPKRECSKCQKRFDPVRNEAMCPECQKTRTYKYYPSTPPRTTRRKPRKSKAFKIEKEMRKQGKNYADYQKERTIAEYARVKL